MPDTTRISYSPLLSQLIADGWLDSMKADIAINHANQQHIPLAHYLVRENIVSSETIYFCCQKNFNGFCINDPAHFNRQLLHENIIHRDLITRYHVLPVQHNQEGLTIALADPSDQVTLAAIRFHTSLFIQPALAPVSLIEQIIHQYYSATRLYAQLENTLSRMVPIEEQSILADPNETPDEPVITFVNQLIEDALQKKCSDIHLEPYEQHCRIRFRRDGLLYEAASVPPYLASRIVTRLKIMAQLNIAERRLPQDGRILWRAPQKLDIRINTCPTLFGEKLVLRLLTNQYTTLSLDKLGMTAQQIGLVTATMTRPQGLILVTGPTGSGKTITLYSILQSLNHIEKNISTVEDPVEIELLGINQISVRPQIGLDFSNVLRTFLRQDPDIMMVGEIRDIDTAAIAMQAAQTGHLVLSTLHTNSAIDAFARLQSMGIAAYQLAGALTLVMAQRLVRTLCDHCKMIAPATTQMNNPLVHYLAAGCQHCHQGYNGRTGVFEVLPVTDITTPLILSGTSKLKIARQACAQGWTSLYENGFDKVRTGITSLSEFHRVIGNINTNLTTR